MKRIPGFLPVVIVLAVALLITAGCSQKFSEYKGEDYKNAWEQLNQYILDNKNEKYLFSGGFGDIKEDYALKAVIYEMVRRGENPEQKIPVKTMSQSEEKLILDKWNDLISKVIFHDDLFYGAFADNPEKAAELLHFSGKTEQDAYDMVGEYYFGKKQFEKSVGFYRKTRKTEQEAYAAMIAFLKVAGSGSFSFFDGHEDEACEIFKKSGMEESKAREYTGYGIVSHAVSRLKYDEPSEEEAAKIIKDAEILANKFANDEKQVIKWFAEVYKRRDFYLRAAELFAKIGDQEQAKDSYFRLAYDYESDGDFEKAILYYEKAGRKEEAEKLRQR